MRRSVGKLVATVGLATVLLMCVSGTANAQGDQFGQLLGQLTSGLSSLVGLG